MKTYMKPSVKQASGGIMSIIENDEDSYEDRSPENMEILSNNLRGDIRSMDDRYAELAQMVGEEQAAQTPPEVVALFQTKMTSPQPMPPVPAAKANGIAGLMGAEEQPPMPGQPPMGGPQPPMPGQPPMPPGAPPTPTGEPPVQRQLGSGVFGEYSPEAGAGSMPGGGFRIDVTGVGDQENDELERLQRESIGPVTQIPEIIAETPQPRGGSFGGFGNFFSRGPQQSQEQQSLLPELQSADSFVEGYQSQGGNIGTLLNFFGQPEPQFQESRNVIGDYLNSIANDPMMSEAPRPVAPLQGIESLGQDTPSISPADMATIDDVATGFTNLQDSGAPPANPAAQQAQAAQRSQKKQNVSSGFSGAGLGKLLGGLAGLGAAFGGKKDKRDPIDQYLRMMAFASPRSVISDSPDNYLDMFGKMPGEPKKISAFDNIPNATSARKPSNVEVFPVKPPDIGVRELPPQNRAKGSSPQGERVEPTFTRIENYVDQRPGVLRANDPFNLPSRGVPAMPASPEAYVSMPKSRPLTPAELAERVAAGERRTLSPATRTLYEMARQKGIDPLILTGRINDMSNFMKKIPGIGKLFKGIEAFNSLSMGKKTAIGGGVSLAAGLALSEDPKPNDGVTPPMPPSRFGVEQIPTEFDTAAKPGEPAPPTPPSPPDDPSAIGGPIDLKPLTPETIGPVDEVTPVDTFGYDENILKEQQAAEQYAPGAERDTSGPALEAAAAQEEDDAYAKAIRKRAKVYQDLLGDTEEERKRKGYLLLAEAGLKMMTGKGRSTGAIIAQSLQGLPSGYGKIAEQSAAIKRAATSAAISDVNAQELAKIKADRSLLSAVYRQQIEDAPRLRKIQNTAQLIAGKEGVSADDPFIQKVAENIVDGTIKADTFGNYRGPDQSVLIYGESTKLNPDDRGYIPANSPFLKPNPAKPIVVQTESEMAKIKTSIAADQKLRNELYTILEDVGEISGLGNVIKRGFSTLTVPIFGDLGPLTEKNLALSNRAKAINPLIKKALATNPERLLKMEAEQLQDLTIDPNKLLTTPGVELAKIVRLITSLDNDINAQYYQINPKNEFRQMSFPNMGTADDPLPAKALQFYGKEYFSMLPNGKLHVRVDDPNTGASTVQSITKQQYETGLRGQ
jgi:hypothetical protein